ncbi:MAG: tandem-95 repeat protein [Pseudomonadota bacterium]
MYNTLTDIPFFGHDRIEYQVFDLEGELSNTASIDILIRPEVSFFPDNPVRPQVTVLGIQSRVDGDDSEIDGTYDGSDPGSTIRATMTEETGLTGGDRGAPFNNLTSDLSTAYQANDWFDIARTSGTPYTYAGLGGNDALLAYKSTVPVVLMGGLNADWLEGGSDSDLLIGGGVGDKKLRTELSNAGDKQVLPDIQLGGAGDNVFTANFEDPAGPLSNPLNPYEARDSIFVLDGGAEMITGPISNVFVAGTDSVATLNANIGFGAAGGAGPTAATAAGLDGDLVKGFDGDDRIVLPFDLTPLLDNSFTGPINLPDSNVSYNVPEATGIVATSLDFSALVGTETNERILDGSVLRGDTTFLDTYFGVIDWNSSEPSRQTDTRFGLNPFDKYEFTFAPNSNFNAFPAILSYDVSATAVDPVTGGAVPQTSLTVTVKAFAFEQTTERVFFTEEYFPFSFTYVGDVGHRYVGTLRERNDLIDPEGLYNGGPVTFTIDLDGQYRDRFEVDFVPLLENSTAPFIHTGDVLTYYSEGTFGGYDYTHIDRGSEAAFTDDAPLGLSIRYVSEAPVGVLDSVSVESGTAQSFNVLDNDTDADGDALQIFNVLADDAYFDGDATNGEILLQTDLNTGFGSGVVTFVAPEDFIGDASFQYILTDGEFETGPIDVSVSVTEAAPLVSDRLIVLEDTTDGVIRFEDFIDIPEEPAPQNASQNTSRSVAMSTSSISSSGLGIGLDVDDAGFTVDGPGRGDDEIFVNAFELFTETVSNPDGSTSEVVAGVKITDRALPIFAQNSYTETGKGGASQAFTFTLTNDAGNASDEGTVTVAVAAQLVLTDQGTLSIAEDTTVAIDVLSARSGGFGEIEVLSVSPPVIDGTQTSAGSAQAFANGMLFTPAENLSGVTAQMTVTVRDAIGNVEQLPVSIDITPVEDAPEVLVDGAAAPVMADEDTPVIGTVTFNDVDTGGVFDALAGNAIATDSGGSFELTATATPGTYAFTYTPDGDFAGVDSVRIELVTPGTTEPVRSAVIDIEVAEVNDAPVFLEAAQDPADATPLNIDSPLELDLFGMARDIDGTLVSKTTVAVIGGDGTVTVTQGADGLISVTGTAAGLAEVQITITDDDGATSETRSLYFDVNASPEAEDDRQILLDPATPILIDALANDSDPDGTVAYRLDENGVPVFYDAAASLDPDGDDDFGIGTAEETPGLLGTVVWSAADNAFLYTAPTDPGLLGQTDVFYYDVEDDDGAVGSAAVYVDLIAPGEVVLRFGEADIYDALNRPEQFVLGQTGHTVRGTAANLDGDEISGIGRGNLIAVTDIAPIDLGVSVSRERGALPDDLSAQQIFDGLSAEGLFGTASQDDLKQAFIGNTLLTLTGPAGSSQLRLTGALPGSFDITEDGQGGSVLTYTPGEVGGGTAGDDDLRSDQPGFAILQGLEGDDVLSVSGLGRIDGGPGQDVLSGDLGPSAKIMIGGPDADLFILGAAGSGARLIQDFNPYEGDRLLISDLVFLNDDQSIDVERLRLDQSNTNSYRLYGNPSERDDDGNLLTDQPEVLLATLSMNPGIAAAASSRDGDQGVDVNGDLAGSVNGLEGMPRTFALETGPAFGSVLVNADGSYTYTPDPDYFGEDSFQYRVTVETAIGPLTQIADVALSVAAEFPIAGGPLGDDLDGSGVGEELSGLAGNDTLTARSGKDVLYGGDGDDELYGGDDADRLYGGDGNDLISGGLGGDLLDGRDGIDTVDYSGELLGVNVFLDGSFTNGGGAAGDQIMNAENLIGTSFDDNLFGDGGSNVIDGGDGRDNLDGRAGSDTLRGGDGFDQLVGSDDWGTDILDGGAGRNLANYFEAAESQIIHFADRSNSAINFGEHTVDDWINITGVIGSGGHSNTIYGDDGINDIIGGLRSDVLYGGGEVDALVGLGDDDSLYGGDGADVIIGGAGLNQLYGGEGRDVFYADADGGVQFINDWIEADDYVLFYQTAVTGFAELEFDDAYDGFSGVRIMSAADGSVDLRLSGASLSDVDEMSNFFFF